MQLLEKFVNKCCDLETVIIMTGATFNPTCGRTFFPARLTTITLS